MRKQHEVIKVWRAELLVCFGLVLCTTCESWAHVGRRFSVEVVNGKLQAQGLNTGMSDGAPLTRPYVNVIHDHWKNVPGLDQAYATLPEYDVSPSAATALLGQSLTLDFVGASRWVSPPMMPSEHTAPVLTPLAPGDLISVEAAAGVADSVNLGSLTLLQSVPFGGIKEVPILYQINSHPTNEVHVLEFILSSSSATVQPSDPVYVLLSPDQSDPMNMLHHAALFLENYLATVPEPTTGAMTLFVACGGLLTKRSLRSPS